MLDGGEPEIDFTLSRRVNLIRAIQNNGWRFVG